MRTRVFFIILMGIFMILTLVGYPHLDPKYKPAQNIFDEMYKKNTNTSNPAYYHGDYEVGIRISRATDENMLDTKKNKCLYYL